MRQLLPAVLVLGSLGCDRPSAGHPAPSASVQVPKPDVCSGGGGTLDDPGRAGWFPRVGAKFCIDPHADFRSYGDGGKAPLGGVCEALPGDCGRYARFGLRYVVIVPYVMREDPRARITVTLLEFAEADSAYALFANELLGDGTDESRAYADVGLRLSFRSGANGVAWLSNHVAFLTYADETSTPDRIPARGATALEELSRWLVGRLPGTARPPLSVELFPGATDAKLPVSYEHGDLFGIAGLGPGALGPSSSDGAAAPLAVLARTDDDAAKDVFRTLRRVPGAQPLKGAPYEAIRVPLREADGAPLVEWLFGRKRSVVFGVGRKREKLERSAEELARHAELLRLKKLLDEAPSPAASSRMR